MSTAAAASLPRLFLYEYLSAGGAMALGEAALLAEGRAMRDAIAADLRNLPLTVAGLPDESGVCSANAGETPLAFVARQAARHDAVWVIAPESEGLLSALCEAVPAARWLGCSAEALAVASSKRRTHAQLAAHGVPVARQGLDAAGRWVIKPDDGAGAVDTRVLATAPREETLRDRYAEPWVDGEPISLSVQVRRGAATLLAVNRQRITIDGAGSLQADLPEPAIWRAQDPRWPVLQQLAAQVVTALPGLAGFIGIDAVWHPQAGPVVIEVNPRATSALVGLSAALGRPVARDIVMGWWHDR